MMCCRSGLSSGSGAGSTFRTPIITLFLGVIAIKKDFTQCEVFFYLYLCTRKPLNIIFMSQNSNFSHPLSLYFDYEEFFRSSTARAQGIANCPPTGAECAAVCHNISVVALICQRARIELAAPIVVTSGYRCAALNRAVGGVDNSCHLRGAAADLKATDMCKLGRVLRSLQSHFQLGGKPLYTIVEEPIGAVVPGWYHIQLTREAEAAGVLVVAALAQS